MADNLYFDNLHKQLYCNHQKRVVALLPGHSDSMAIGLSDFAELPGQSTWYIRSVVFKVTGYTDVGGPSPDNEISFLGGSCNRDISATDKPELADFQDIAGWPWKGINSMIQVQSTLQANRFSWTKTYRPSKISKRLTIDTRGFSMGGILEFINRHAPHEYTRTLTH